MFFKSIQYEMINCESGIRIWPEYKNVLFMECQFRSGIINVKFENCCFYDCIISTLCYKNNSFENCLFI